jgi:tetratricopeptide (TPR) repeat protein
MFRTWNAFRTSLRRKRATLTSNSTAIGHGFAVLPDPFFTKQVKVMLNKKFFLIIILAIISLGGSACVRQQAADRAIEVSGIQTPADQQIKLARDLVVKMPGVAKYHVRLAAAVLSKVRETGDYSLNRKAEESINKAMEIDPENFDAQILQTQIYLSEHKFREGLDLAKKLESANPDSQAVLAAITDAQTELGLYEEAVGTAQKFVNQWPNSTSYTRVAHLRSLYGDTAGAIEARQLALRIADPGDKEGLAWFNSELGREYWAAGKIKEAESSFDRALEIFPDYHWALAGKGKVLAGRGEYDRAIGIYETLVSRVPQTDRAIFLGDLYKITGRGDAAQKIYEETVKRETAGSGGDMHRLALFWADHDTNLDMALDVARQDRAKNGDLLASDILAWCLYKKGQYAEAKSYMTEALRLKTKNASFYYHLGMIENALGNKKEAVRNLKLALETNPAFDLLQAGIAKQKLEEL